jgi:deoxyribonuclease V
MSPHKPHRWDVSIAEAKAIQSALAEEVISEDRFGKITHVAGVDVGFEENNSVTRAAVAVLGFPALQPCAQALARRPTRFPYVPGYLSFREIPAVLDALETVSVRPDLILCDGQGRAHPRRFGLACHLGVLTDIPTIGVAKSRLIGTHAEVGEDRGAWQPLMDGEDCIGAVLRTRKAVRPLYISVGHRVSLATAIDLVLRCTPRYRLPETTRAAHRLASG